MPKMVRNPECNLYNDCLDVAYKNHVKEFSCEDCDGKTLFKPNQKKKLNRVYVDFTQHPKLYNILITEARKYHISMSRQVLYWCNLGHDISEKTPKQRYQENQNDNINQIKTEVSIKTGISIKEMESPSRRKHIIRARNMAMKRCREIGATLEMIGKAFNRTHATVIHSIAKKEV